MEKTRSVDQKSAARAGRVKAEIAARPGLFAACGAVVASWRTYRGRRLGPYYRLAYREGGRQRSIYLGRCAELARRVRGLLERLHRPGRERRRLARLQAQVRRSLRRWKARLARELAGWGVRVKGYEFRGAARALAAWRPGRSAGAPLGSGVACNRGAGAYHAEREGESGEEGSAEGASPEGTRQGAEARRRKGDWGDGSGE